MIYTGVFCNMAELRYMGGFNGGPRRSVNEWELLKDLLEHTDDTVVYIITRAQMPDFNRYIKKYGLEQYLILDHRDQKGKEQGSANWNYHGDPRKLKLMVLKGKGESQ